MVRDDLAGIPDGGVLRILPGGLAVVRRKKHEAIDVLALSRDELQRQTGKVMGSKFDESWHLDRILSEVSVIVEKEGWVVEPGVRRQTRWPFDLRVGFVDGQPVATLCVVSDGRYVHAYPDRDDPWAR